MQSPKKRSSSSVNEHFEGEHNKRAFLFNLITSKPLFKYFLEANIIAHVIDVSNPNYRTQREDVLCVLHELGLEKIEYEDNYIEVFNKIDLLDEDERKRWLDRCSKNIVALSAYSGDGVEELLNLLLEKFAFLEKVEDVVLDIADGKAIAEVYRNADVLERVDDFENSVVRIKAKRRMKI